MTNIIRATTSASGKAPDLNINIDGTKISGYADGYKVTGIAVVQNRKCLKIADGPAPYLPITDALYAEIDGICKANFAANMTEKERKEVEMDKAEALYEKLNNSNASPAEIIAAREVFFALRREWMAM